MCKSIFRGESPREVVFCKMDDKEWTYIEFIKMCFELYVILSGLEEIS
jgi:hypothetical protein